MVFGHGEPAELAHHGDRDPVFMERVLGTVPCRRAAGFVGSCKGIAGDGHG